MGVPDRHAVGQPAQYIRHRRDVPATPGLTYVGYGIVLTPIPPPHHAEEGMTVLDDVDHVGIATFDLEAEVERYRRAFGMEPVHRETVEAQGVEEVLFRAGKSWNENVRDRQGSMRPSITSRLNAADCSSLAKCEPWNRFWRVHRYRRS